MVQGQGSRAERTGGPGTQGQGQAAASHSCADKELGASIPAGAMPKSARWHPGCLHSQVGGWAVTGWIPSPSVRAGGSPRCD